tara:strand:+ start:210 stop:1046 length:837 start_codon:yes stop_codon:yes gene_type:complete
MAKIISFQGDLGCYSHQACSEIYPGAIVKPCETFEEAVLCVKNKSANGTILPVENSTYGRVSIIHELLRNTGLLIVDEYFLRVKINLYGTKDSKIDEIKKAFSHSVLLGQCKKFLSSRNITPCVHSDTAGAVKFIAENNNEKFGALASSLAGDIYGLKELATNVEDMKNNTTRFLVLSDSQEKNVTQKNCITTVIFKVRNIPSSLYKALGGFATNNVNIVKLESYMIGGSFASTQFYADIEGHPEQTSVKMALEELEYFTSSVKIIGVYKRHEFRKKK